jgi:Rad3-related DNA helicase
MKIMKITVLTVVAILVGLAGSIRAQEAYRLSEREMKELLSRIDKQSEVFRGSLKRAMNHSRLDDTKAEDRINDFVKDFSEATDRLKHRYSDKRTASADVEEVLSRAARIDDFMTRHELSHQAESDWAALRSNLDSLADAYNVTWSWTDRTRP